MSASREGLAYNFGMQIDLGWNKRVGPLLLLLGALLFIHVPILQLLGMGRWMLAGRWFSRTPVSSTVLFFLFYFLSVYCILFWPLKNLKRRNNLKVVLMSALVSLPLLTFSAWQGKSQAWWEIADSAMTIFPAAWVSVHCALRRREYAMAALFLSVVTFTPVFLINDIMTPFPVLFGFSARVSAFAHSALVIRGLSGLICLPLPLCWSWVAEEEGPEDLPREFLSSLKPQHPCPAEG